MKESHEFQFTREKSVVHLGDGCDFNYTIINLKTILSVQRSSQLNICEAVESARKNVFHKLSCVNYFDEIGETLIIDSDLAISLESKLNEKS